MKELFQNIFLIDGRLAVRNPVPGFKPFDEDVLIVGGKEFRVWDHCRSKAGAAIMKGIKEFPITEGSKVLYLGIAHGYTCSFLSSVVGERGVIYGVEFSERCFNELLPLCNKYKNIIPILADARNTEEYSWVEKVDAVFCDISDPQETEIFIRNMELFLKPGGYGMMAIKSSSIDITRKPQEIYKTENEKLRVAGFEIVDFKELDPYEFKHGFVLVRKS